MSMKAFSGSSGVTTKAVTINSNAGNPAEKGKLQQKFIRYCYREVTIYFMLQTNDETQEEAQRKKKWTEGFKAMQKEAEERAAEWAAQAFARQGQLLTEECQHFIKIAIKMNAFFFSGSSKHAGQFSKPAVTALGKRWRKPYINPVTNA